MNDESNFLSLVLSINPFGSVRTINSVCYFIAYYFVFRISHSLSCINKNHKPNAKILQVALYSLLPVTYIKRANNKTRTRH